MILDHIGVAVRSIAQRAPLYADILGLSAGSDEILPEMGVRFRMLELENSKLELLEPYGDASPVEKFLSKKGEGIHHICLGVASIQQTLKRLSDAGMQLIDREPREGHGGSLVAFIDPRATGGVLIELKEAKELNALDVLSQERISRGAIVIVSLMNPKEKFWGILRVLDTVGVELSGIELGAVGDLFREVSKGGRGSMGLTSIFFPMWRVEKVFLDESVGGVKSLHEHFATLASASFQDLLIKLTQTR